MFNKIFRNVAHLQNAGNKSGYKRLSYNEISDLVVSCGRFSTERQKKERRGFSLHCHWLLGPINHEWNAPLIRSRGLHLYVLLPYTVSCLTKPWVDSTGHRVTSQEAISYAENLKEKIIVVVCILV